MRFVDATLAVGGIPVKLNMDAVAWMAPIADPVEVPDTETAIYFGDGAPIYVVESVPELLQRAAPEPVVPVKRGAGVKG
jgi:hypothetical protein